MAEKQQAQSLKDVKAAEDGLEPTKSFTAGEVELLDESAAFLYENNITDEYLAELVNDKEMNRRLVRKIDLTILPLLAGTYVLQYIDKQALSYAAVFDLFDSTGVTQTQYSWFASIFYLAYLVAEYPWVYVAQKTRMGKVVAGCVLSWGSVLMITAACSNFPGLAVCRFFLGAFEAPITTCFMMMVSMWYVRAEQPFRAGIFYCCNGVGSMLGGILSYGIGQISGFPVWKAVFMICGGITVIWGGVLLFFLPDSILSAKRFTLEERALLVGRARLARTGVLNKTIKWYQVKEACLDPQVWLLTLFVLLNEVINGGVANFGKLIIKGLVSDPLLTTALGIPQGAFQVFWILSGTYTATRFRNHRTTVMAVWLIPTIIGCCMIWKLDRTHYKIGVLFGYYLIGCFVASLVLALQMPATNLGGYTKRITASAIVFTAYCVGNVIGPHAFLAREAPLYQTGCKVILACSAAQMVIAVSLRMMLIRRNKARDAAAAAAGHAPDAEHEDEGVDLTDMENPNFRYVL
ncbi:Putative major facilitator superfamily, MFS transporter superfamily [Colletotrichum destructivum]|uniref:Major facilitator superfamily, MFS transporter superfamily n=1 Tax=Colletotrichum destructivum TaxID=34406 RepID=A0AAX4IUE7_9PEZI|nr:Putative major facilitator superfamily, MFS transporter superfamily [Colletotrichum destructivum]